MTASPTPETTSLVGQNRSKKLRKIVKPGKPIAKTIWLTGHAISLCCGFSYSLFYFTRSRNWISWILYKFTLFGVLLAYSISIQNQYSIKSLPHWSALISSDNFQYLLLGTFWIFNRNSFFKILPFLIISLLQLSQNFKIQSILKFEKKLSILALYDELFLFVLLTFDTLLMRGTSGYGLVIYSLFMWLKLLQSEDTRYFIYDNIKKLDALMSKIKNEKIQKAWRKVKKFLSLKQANFEQKYL